MSGQPAVVHSSSRSLSVRSLGAFGLVLFLVFLSPGLCAGLLPCGLEREKGSEPLRLGRQRLSVAW